MPMSILNRPTVMIQSQTKARRHRPSILLFGQSGYHWWYHRNARCQPSHRSTNSLAAHRPVPKHGGIQALINISWRPWKQGPNKCYFVVFTPYSGGWQSPVQRSFWSCWWQHWHFSLSTASWGGEVGKSLCKFWKSCETICLTCLCVSSGFTQKPFWRHSHQPAETLSVALHQQPGHL